MLSRFGKSSPASPAKSSLSVIGADMRIVGDVRSDGEVQVDGQIEGDIACDKLVVGEGGRITGEVNARMVRFHGSMQGQIRAENVRIAKTARIIGDITHETLEIEAGAYLEGHLVHKSSSPRPAEPSQVEDGKAEQPALPAPFAEAQPA